MDVSPLKRRCTSQVTSEGKKAKPNVDVRDETYTIKAGSRKSPLAVTQTNTIVNALKTLNPDYDFPIETMQTLGDRILHLALPKIGGKGLFTKDLEIALSEKRVDFLVHSLKDCPTKMPEGMALGCVYKRDNPYDCVIFHSKHNGKTLSDLPPDSIIGTSSLRRVAQLKRRFPSLVFQSVRGNLNTRLRKLEDECLYDAIILAKAGVDRMGWTERIGQILKDEMAYAVGQGAMAVEIRDDDKYMMKVLGGITDMKTLLTVSAERAFMRKLDGGCSTPVGCNAEFKDGKFYLRGVCLSVDGKDYVEDTLSTTISYDLPRPADEKEKTYFVSDTGCVCDTLYKDEYTKAVKLGNDVALRLIELGADEILRVVKESLPGQNVTNIQLPVANSSSMKFC